MQPLDVKILHRAQTSPLSADQRRDVTSNYHVSVRRGRAPADGTSEGIRADTCLSNPVGDESVDRGNQSTGEYHIVNVRLGHAWQERSAGLSWEIRANPDNQGRYLRTRYASGSLTSGLSKTATSDDRGWAAGCEQPFYPQRCLCVVHRQTIGPFFLNATSIDGIGNQHGGSVRVRGAGERCVDVKNVLYKLP